MDDWIEDAEDTLPHQAPEDVTIWVDSVDYQIQGRRSYGGLAHLDPERVTVHAPHAEPRGRRRDDADMAVLTDAQRRYNAQVQRKRARIENYFATSRSKFEALQQAWAEDEDQLDALVWYAAAVMNRMKDLRNQ